MRGSLLNGLAAPSFPTVRNERNKGYRLWCEIPDTSFLGSGMTPKNQFNITIVTLDYKGQHFVIP